MTRTRQRASRTKKTLPPNSQFIIVVHRDHSFIARGPKTHSRPRKDRRAQRRHYGFRRRRAAKIHQRLTPPSTVQLVHYINASLVFIHNRRNRHQESMASDATEGGRRILLDNSRVYVRFLPFVSGRVHLGRLNKYSSILGAPLEDPSNVRHFRPAPRAPQKPSSHLCENAS